MCWWRWPQVLQRRSAAEKPTSPHRLHTVPSSPPPPRSSSIIYNNKNITYTRNNRKRVWDFFWEWWIRRGWESREGEGNVEGGGWWWMWSRGWRLGNWLLPVTTCFSPVTASSLSLSLQNKKNKKKMVRRFHGGEREWGTLHGLLQPTQCCVLVLVLWFGSRLLMDIFS